MTESRADYDSPWKQVLEDYFVDFIRFFFPAIHADIDWTQGYEFLDTELKQVVRDAELGKRLADKLIKVYKAGGEELWVLVHCEIQAQAETNFAERMFTYNYRLRNRYNRPVVSLAVLADERPNWRPTGFNSELWGCQVNFRFPVVKLLDYDQDWASLEEELNPFATVVMAHLKALETKDQQVQRKEWKFNLTRRLYEKGYDRQDILNLFQFIDWVMALPDEFEDEFEQELEQELERYEREMQMPYVTRIERKAEQRGLIEGLVLGIETGLELKFGSEGLQLLPEIAQISNVETLKAIQTGIKQVSSLDELRSIYHPENL